MGISVPLPIAMLVSTLTASCSLPLTSSHLGDSGMVLVHIKFTYALTQMLARHLPYSRKFSHGAKSRCFCG